MLLRSGIQLTINFDIDMDLQRETYTLHARPQSITDWMREQEMLISMEKQRIAKQFPWKRKGYRKHIK